MELDVANQVSLELNGVRCRAGKAFRERAVMNLAHSSPMLPVPARPSTPERGAAQAGKDGTGRMR